MKKPVLIGIWTSVFFFLVVFFTLFQVPNEKIANNINGQIQSQLDPIGIYIIPNQIDFSILKGFRLLYTRPTIELPDLTRVQLDELIVRPSFGMLIRGFAGANISFKQGAGNFDLSAGVRGSRIRVSGNFQQLELARLGVFAWAGGIQGKALFSGDVQFTGSLSEPNSFAGTIQATGKGVQIDEQTVFGFPVPEIKLQECVFQIPIEAGKVLFKDVRLGKATPSDDITLQISGDITLARNINSSPLNLKLLLGMAPQVKAKFAFIDTLFPSAVQPDGRYQFALGGTLNAPMPIK